MIIIILELELKSTQHQGRQMSLIFNNIVRLAVVKVAKPQRVFSILSHFYKSNLQYCSSAHETKLKTLQPVLQSRAKKVHEIGLYGQKWPQPLAEVGMSLPCPSSFRLMKTFFKSHNFFIMEKSPVSEEFQVKVEISAILP